MGFFSWLFGEAPDKGKEKEKNKGKEKEKGKEKKRSEVIGDARVVMAATSSTVNNFLANLASYPASENEKLAIVATSLFTNLAKLSRDDLQEGRGGLLVLSLTGESKVRSHFIYLKDDGGVVITDRKIPGSKKGYEFVGNLVRVQFAIGLCKKFGLNPERLSSELM